MRSEEEIRRAIGILIGVYCTAEASGEELPEICPSQFQTVCLALDWAIGKENPFGALIERFVQAFANNGTGVDEMGRPYDLHRMS